MGSMLRLSGYDSEVAGPSAPAVPLWRQCLEGNILQVGWHRLDDLSKILKKYLASDLY